MQGAGIKAVHYNDENLKPPVAVVVPSEDYVDINATSMRMNTWNIKMSILIISGGTTNNNLDELDDLLEKTIMVLSDPNDGFCTLRRVLGPVPTKIKSNSYYSALVEVEYQTQFTK